MKKYIDVTVWIGTYEKYNKGKNDCVKLVLTDFTSLEDFYKACAEYHKDEQDPEFMLADYETNCSIIKSLIEDFEIHDNIFDIIDALESARHSWDVYEAYTEIDHSYDPDEDVTEWIKKVDNYYVGTYKDFKSFVQESVLDSVEKQNPLIRYIDWKKAEREYEYDYSHSGGIIFCIQ